MNYERARFEIELETLRVEKKHWLSGKLRLEEKIRFFKNVKS